MAVCDLVCVLANIHSYCFVLHVKAQDRDALQGEWMQMTVCVYVCVLIREVECASEVVEA